MTAAKITHNYLFADDSDFFQRNEERYAMDTVLDVGACDHFFDDACM